MTRAIVAAALVACAIACSGAAPPTQGAPADAGAHGDASASASDNCSTLIETRAYACAEERFWAAFRRADLAGRKDAEAALLGVIAGVSAPSEKRGMSLMHFRLGQLRLAMALENAQRDYVLRSNTDIVGEFDRATSLDAYDGIIAPWKDAMQIATAAVLSDWGAAVALADRGFANVALNPMGNTLSLSGTTIGFPLSTGVPQKTASLLDAWKCANVAWCDRNTEHAPFARPGLSYHFAEAYARVGDRAKAAAYVNEALRAPDADAWPYRFVAAAAAADVDAFTKKFADLGSEGSAFAIAYANQPYGCLFCHAQR